MNVDFIIPGGSGKIKTLVPIMNSNEQDGITLSSNSSGQNQQNEVYKLFDGDISTPPFSNASLWLCANGQYILVEFPSPISVKMILTYSPYTSAYSAGYPASISVSASSDGVSFDPVIVSETGDKNNRIMYVLSPSAKKFYKFFFATQPGHSWVALSEIVLF